MFNELDKRILQVLLEEKAPIPSKSLALRCDASINTVRKEISIINETVEYYGFRIESKTSVGHYLMIYNYKLAEPYINRLRYLYKRNRHLQNQNSSRVQYLTRRCLCAPAYLTPESLCDELYCSRSTLQRDLEKVRRNLEPFDLRLVNRRGGDGLHVEGNEWNLRQCLIYQHKVYRLEMEENGYKEYGFKSLFFMLDGIDYYEQMRRILIQCLKEQRDFTIPFMSTPKILHYIELIASRQKQAAGCRFTPEQIERVKNTAEYGFVKKLHGKLPDRFREAFQENDFLAVSMLILSFETQNFHLESYAEYPSYYAETQELIVWLSKIWDYPAGLFDEVFVRDCICFLYTLHNRRVFRVYNDTESLGFIRHKGIRTADFCICFARFYEEKHGIHLEYHDTLSAFYLFHRVLKEHDSCYYAQRLLVISRYGISYAKSLAANIRLGYGNEIESVTAREFCEMQDEEFREYDLLITDVERQQVPLISAYALPVLSLDFTLGPRSCPELDEYLAEVERKAEREILHSDSFIRTNLKSRQEVFEYLAGLYENQGIGREDFVGHLAENDRYINLEREHGIVFLPVFFKEIKRPQITVLLNRTAFIWNENRSQIFVCYTRACEMRADQVISKLLSRFVHITAETAQALLRRTGADPEQILYAPE